MTIASLYAFATVICSACLARYKFSYDRVPTFGDWILAKEPEETQKKSLFKAMQIMVHQDEPRGNILWADLYKENLLTNSERPRHLHCWANLTLKRAQSNSDTQSPWRNWSLSLHTSKEGRSPASHSFRKGQGRKQRPFIYGQSCRVRVTDGEVEAFSVGHLPITHHCGDLGISCIHDGFRVSPSIIWQCCIQSRHLFVPLYTFPFPIFGL